MGSQKPLILDRYISTVFALAALAARAACSSPPDPVPSLFSEEPVGSAPPEMLEPEAGPLRFDEVSRDWDWTSPTTEVAAPQSGCRR